MKPVIRLVAATLAGLLIGWGIQSLLPASPSAVAGPAAALSPPTPAAGPQSPEGWVAWLEACVPLTPIPDTGAFWDRMPAYGGCSMAEWSLARDEAFLTMQDAVFLSVLTDGRFSRFPHLYEAEQAPSFWSRRLLGLGLGQALEMAGRMPTKWLNAHLDHQLLDLLAKQDPERGFERIMAGLHRDPDRTGNYLKRVASLHPDKVAALFAKLESSVDKQIYAGRILEAFVERDWRQAEKWGRENLTAEEWKSAAKEIFNGYTGGRIAELREIGDRITDPVLRSVAYSRWTFWPATTSEKTLERALSLLDGSLTSDGWQEVGRTCGMRELRTADPAASAAMLRQLALRVPEEEQAGFLEQAVAISCYNGDPLGAQFYETLKPDLLEKLSAGWTQKDPAAASAWLTTLPPSERRDIAVLAFCRGAASVDPSGAAAWALTLLDPAARETSVRSALALWRQKEPAAADRWALESGVAAPGE